MMATNSDRNTPFPYPTGAISSTQIRAMWPEAKPAQDKHSFDRAEAVLSPDQRKQLDDAVAKAKIKTEAVKFDSGKVDWTLVPFEALEGMVQVLEFGAVKYSRNNWQMDNGFKWTRVAASALRHLFAWLRGEDNDPESGLSHISHCQCNLLFLAYYIRNKSQASKDNRNV